MHIFRLIHVDEIDVVIDGVGCTEIPGAAVFRFIRRKHVDAAVAAVEIPGLAVAQISVEDQRLVLGQDANRVDPGGDAVGEAEIDDPVFAAEGHRRFCVFLGQCQKAAALASGQKHSDTLFFTHERPSL